MTDIDLPGLAACPFCGGPAAESAQYPHIIVCADVVGCGAIGPNHFFKRVTREAWNTRAASAPDGVVACRVMTPEEYQAFKIQGWHCVHKDYDGFGAVAVSYGAAPQSFTSGHIAGQREMQEALAWCVSEIELEFSRNTRAFPADSEKKKLFENAKALSIASLPVSAGTPDPCIDYDTNDPMGVEKEINESDGGQEDHGRSAGSKDRVATPADADPTHWPSRKDPVQVDRLAPSDPSPAPVGDAAFGCRRAGGFVDHNCMVACDCDRTMRLKPLTTGEKAGAVAIGNVFIDPRPETNIPDLPSIAAAIRQLSKES